MGVKTNEDEDRDDELEDDEELDDEQDPEGDEDTEDDDPEDGEDADLEGLTPEEITAKIKAERTARREGETALEALKRENKELREAKEPAGDRSGKPTNGHDPERAAMLGAGIQALRASKDPKDKVILAVTEELLETRQHVADEPNLHKIRRYAGEDEAKQEALIAEVREVKKRHGAPNMGVAFQLWKGEQFDKGVRKTAARTKEVEAEVTRRKTGTVRTGARPVGGANKTEKGIPKTLDDADYQKRFNAADDAGKRELLARRRDGRLDVRPPAPRG